MPTRRALIGASLTGLAVAIAGCGGDSDDGTGGDDGTGRDDGSGGRAIELPTSRGEDGTLGTDSVDGIEILGFIGAIEGATYVVRVGLRNVGDGTIETPGNYVPDVSVSDQQGEFTVPSRRTNVFDADAPIEPGQEWAYALEMEFDEGPETVESYEVHLTCQGVLSGPYCDSP